MRYFLAFVCPPLALIGIRPTSVILTNGFLVSLLYLPAIVHALQELERHKHDSEVQAILSWAMKI